KRVKEFEAQGMNHKKAVSATSQTVADPGTSEHHTGLAFDITVKGTTFKGTEQQKWLQKHCWDYGFVIRYQEDKEAITGFLAECWHVRYVGLNHSIAMRDGNLCLEEYLGTV
ncbi:MAG: M15 family metallopeptidase, partial [Clostridia bacterium]